MGWFPQRVGLPSQNGSGAAAAVPPTRNVDTSPEWTILSNDNLLHSRRGYWISVLLDNVQSCNTSILFEFSKGEAVLRCSWHLFRLAFMCVQDYITVDGLPNPVRSSTAVGTPLSRITVIQQPCKHISHDESTRQNTR